MTPDQRITRRELFGTVAERLGQTAIVASILAACNALAVDPLRVGTETQKDGWQHFVSSNYPYEIDFPPGWLAGTQQVMGKTQDIFKGEISEGFQTNVVVMAEPTSKSFDQFSSDALFGLVQLMGSRPGPLAGGYETKVAGEKASVLNAKIPRGALLINPEVEHRLAVFVKDKRGWSVGLTCVPSVLASEESTFLRMVQSFKFK